MPSSWTSTRRASANAASASACRPHRYSASISCPLNRSLSGCARTSSVSWPAASAARPSSSRIVDVLLGGGQPLLAEPGPDDLRPRAGNAVERDALPQPAAPTRAPPPPRPGRPPAGTRARRPAVRRTAPASSWPGASRSRYPRPLACSTWPGRPVRAAPARAPPAAGRRGRAARSPIGRAARRPRSRRSAHRARPPGSPAPPAARGPPAAAARRARVPFPRARPAPARARPPAAAARRRPVIGALVAPGRRRQARRRKSRSPPSGRGHRRMTPDRIGASSHRPLNWHFQSTLREQQEAVGDS